MTSTSARRRALFGGLAALVIAVGGLAVFTATYQPREPVVCLTGALIIEVDGHGQVWPEDQGDPGRGDCDGSKTGRHSTRLGFDCKLRAPGGEVIDAFDPNRADGTCGQPDPGDDWPTGFHTDR